MFNLIQGIDCVEGRQKVALSRIYSDELPPPGSVTDFEQRSSLPTIVMDEGAPLSKGTAHFVRLSDFEVSPKEVSFELRVEGSSFRASILEDAKSKHSLNDVYKWHHTCWQYGKGNIFETLYRSASSQVLYNQPKVFSVRQPPKIDPQVAACMMPFAAEFDDVYSSINDACSDADLTCLRVDEIYNNGPIIKDVIDAIDRAQVVICDLTGRNPNVMYETGISHALGREVIIIAQDIQNEVPFDLKHLRVIGYNGANQAGRDQLKATLYKTIKSVCG